MDRRFVDESAVDLYDHEVAKVGRIWQEATQRFSHKPATQKNLGEMCKWIEHALFEKGLIGHVDTQGVLIGEPPTVVVTGRIDKSHDLDFDHDRKKFEVVGSKTRNEVFRGQKEKYDG